MTTVRRIAPALALLFLSPLIAEYLLGDFNIRQIGFIVVFIPLYGGGALLVREITRRARRGWPTLLLLALAYALIEEGWGDQTLFNPHYAGKRLLDYGFIPALGTSLNFAAYLLTLHVVWSIGASVALAEGLAGPRWREPWLRRPGFLAIAALYLLGCAIVTAFTLRTFHFVASASEFAAVGFAIAATIIAAFKGFRAAPNGAGANRDGTLRVPSFCLVFGAALALSSVFQLWFGYAPRHGLNAGLSVAVLLGLDAAAVVLVVS